MPGIRVKIFSLQRIRNFGSCSYTFEGMPEPGKPIPIFHSGARKIATIQETSKARLTLICDWLKGRAERKRFYG